jgi:hypothetical protein
MPFELFGLKFGKTKQERDEQRLPSFVPPSPDDGAVVVETGGFYGQYVDLDGSTRSDYELITKYRDMSLHPECENAVEEIVNEIIDTSDKKNVVRINVDNVKMDEEIKSLISKEFETVLNLLDFNTRGYELFRRWYIDSRLYFHIIVNPDNMKRGIVELRYIDPLNLQKIREFKKDNRNDGSRMMKEFEDYYIFHRFVFPGAQRNQVTSPDVQGLRISPDAIAAVHSGLYDTRNRRIVGYMHKAIKALNQLRMMEDAVVIYRISRAPERRIFYVDVGNLPKQKAEQYLRDLMNKHRNKLVYDANTGEIRDDRRFMTMLEDYWMPRREGGKGTQIETLPGGQNLSEMEDVKYFQKKLYRSLNVPISRLESETGFNLGRSTEITRDEVKFAKFVNRLRTKFTELFLDLLGKQLVMREIITMDEWDKIKNDIHFDFKKDTYFSELKEAELRKEKVDELMNIGQFIGKYFSYKWVRKNVLKFTDEEIERLEKEIDDERKKGQIPQDQTEFGL